MADTEQLCFYCAQQITVSYPSDKPIRHLCLC